MKLGGLLSYRGHASIRRGNNTPSPKPRNQTTPPKITVWVVLGSGNPPKMTQHFQVDITFLLALKKKHMDFSHVTLGYKNPISGVGHIPYLQTPFIKKSSEVSAGEHEEALEVLGEAGLQQPLLGMILQGITPRKISHVLSEKYISP